MNAEHCDATQDAPYSTSTITPENENNNHDKFKIWLVFFYCTKFMQNPSI